MPTRNVVLRARAWSDLYALCKQRRAFAHATILEPQPDQYRLAHFRHIPTCWWLPAEPLALTGQSAIVSLGLE